MALPQRTLGPWEVSAMGLGCLPLSSGSPNRLEILNDPEGAVAVIHAALDAGITLIDTADIYAPRWNAFGHNERLVGAAFSSWNGSPEAKNRVVIATKGGITRGPGESWGLASSLNYLLRAVEASALRLGVNQIKLWQHHRLDPSIVFEDQFENVLALLERGLIERIGVSNYSAEQLRRAVKMGGTPDQGGIISVQNQFSPRYRNEAEVMDVCEEFGIAYLPWSPLGGISRAEGIATGEFGAFGAIGETLGVSAYATAIAWLLQTSPTVIPIPGASKTSSVRDNLDGLMVSLTEEEMSILNSSLPENVPLDEELLAQPAFRKN
jgi:aryl-alcohol dehydrogenase-like predicted oxidoreductase